VGELLKGGLYMIPKGLKIGDTFTENYFDKQVLFKVIGFDGAGNYISTVAKDEEKFVPVGDLVGEELPFTTPDDELVETKTAEAEKVDTETTEDTTEEETKEETKEETEEETEESTEEDSEEESEEETVETETVEEQPIVEEVKKEVKKPASKKTTSKKKTTKKK
jgi:hypothetical protein